MTDPAARDWLRWPHEPDRARFGYGADYNPEQWPREVWEEDLRLMRRAGVNIVTLGVFSWSRLQPGPDTWDFGWLDEIMDRLHENGIAVDLATATASPPAWLTTAHPEVLPVTRTGETVWPGARQHWRPTSPVFRRYALALTTALAERYGGHPSLAAWHVSNELGCHNAHDYSDDAAAAFRAWLRGRYATIDGLNHAWATDFWSQRYTDWDQVLPPRLAASHVNPTQQLDFARFSSDALRDHLRAEREILRRHTPDIPVTTNFMVMGHVQEMNYADWAHEVDFVSNDHYVRPDPTGADELSFSANLTGGLARGRPWYLMEHSTSAVNWRAVNPPKAPGELARDSLLHVAHGADAVCYFQWRQSAAGAEKYHSAMVPHAGSDSRVFRDVAELGRVLAEDLAEVAGTRRSPARAALVFDWESRWAVRRDSLPSSLLNVHTEALDWYTAFLDLGVRVDVVPTDADWEEYDLVVAPLLHLLPGATARRLDDYVAGGGHLVTTYFSGIVDENDHVHLGGYPGPLRDLLGLSIEEFAPLPEGARVTLDDGATGTLWSDRITVTSPETEVLTRYADGPLAGGAASTRRAVPGGGSAAYVSTRLDDEHRVALLRRLTREAGVDSELPEDLRGRVEATVRAGEDAAYLFLTNRTDEPVKLDELSGTPLTGADVTGEEAPVLRPRGTTVLRVPVADVAR
ncbi:beta-galactosidase [Nocardiopsis sp. MG754419]|uniref:beta-galactosidase n=1 Tax=Nocardiopsis sp. MG754419 TaxID=2259865 RepID=UPI001BA6A1A5|nr:beta-galactosidase [Nocardiopsis sp. MG754419]MBR8742945.1 beta-galactosidase [Nocardiopsis sp. MG754419]